MGSVKDITGEKFGRLFIEHACGLSSNGRGMLWACVCDCGSEVRVLGASLRDGNTKSCGCLKAEATLIASSVVKSHGHAGGKRSSTYRTWSSMKNRCTNKNDQAYENYGGRGIFVCERWNLFENFLADMGERPKNTTLDRIDNSLGYCKENCRWAARVQQENNKRTNRPIVIDGVTKNLSEWARCMNISPSTISWRIKNGWSDREAVVGRES